MNYRPDIDGLRTIAVVPVVLFHTGLALPGGFIGVDIFFVISGFLITTILWNDLQTNQFSITRFYERRMRRILPALVIVMLVSTGLATLLLLPGHLADFGKSVFAANIFLSNLYFYTETDYFTEAAHLKPMLHTWSLAVEEQYYILFPLILALLYRLSQARSVLFWLGLTAITSFAAAVWMVQFDPPGAFYLPHTRAWELLLGSISALCVAEGWGKGLARTPMLTLGLAIGAAIMILWPMVSYGPDTVFPGLSALPPCAGAALLILTGAYRTTAVAQVLSTTPMVFIGKISYSLYLWHWPVLVFAGYATLAPLGVSKALGCLAVSFLLAVLSWRFIEAPFRRPTSFSRQAIFTMSGAAILVMVSLGGTLIVTKGLPARISPDVQALLEEEHFLHDHRDCHFVTPRRAETGDICQRGAPNTAPRFVLVGDSHADAFSPAIFAAAETLGISGYQYTQAGFRPLLGVEKQGDPSYSAQTDAFVAFLKTRPDLQTVIITAFWQHQITGSTYRHQGDVWFDPDQVDTSDQTNRSVTITGLTRLAAMFPERHFVLLDDVPSGYALDLKHTHGRCYLGPIDVKTVSALRHRNMPYKEAHMRISLNRLQPRPPTWSIAHSSLPCATPESAPYSIIMSRFLGMATISAYRVLSCCTARPRRCCRVF